MRTRHSLLLLLALAGCARARTHDAAVAPREVAEPSRRDDDAPDRHATVAVVVVENDSSRAPVAGAMVRLLPARAARDTAARTTDAQGLALLLDRPAGEYALHVAHGERVLLLAPVRVPAACAVEIEVRLPTARVRTVDSIVRGCPAAR